MEFAALKDFSYTFKDKGLYCITGKSGSGKSTIANLASTLDKPTKGNVFYKGNDLSSFNEKQLNFYRNNEIGLIFQHYNLLENDTVLDNVILPHNICFINNHREKRKDSIKRAIELLKKFNIDESFKNKIVKNLSGGEQQRVAIARSLINNPKIIIADEPTGALDVENSIQVMEILKEISLTKLVIVISHNKELVDKYADEIIEIVDGKQQQQNEVILEEEKTKIPKKNQINKNSWTFIRGLRRIKNNLVRNLLILGSLIFSICAIFSTIGFINGSKVVCEKCSYERFDYASATINKVLKSNINGSSLKLEKMIRYSSKELMNQPKLTTNYSIYNNYDYLVGSNPNFEINQIQINGILFCPIEKFENNTFYRKLLLRGSIPSNRRGIIINDLADSLIKKSLNIKTPIGQKVKFNIEKKVLINKNAQEETKKYDTFHYDHSYMITGVVKEFSFLATPKIYYSYKTLDEDISLTIMNNLSELLKREYTFKDFIHDAKNDNEISSFSHRIFFKDFSNLSLHKELVRDFNKKEGVSLTSESVVISETFKDLINGAELGLKIFVLISIIGMILILGISSFSSYVFERKKTAILFALGISKDNVSDIFLVENIAISFISFVLALLLLPGFIYLLNLFILNVFNIPNFIINPFQNLNKNSIIAGICSVLILLLIVFIITLLPIYFSKKVNLKEELQDE